MSGVRKSILKKKDKNNSDNKDIQNDRKNIDELDDLESYEVIEYSSKNSISSRKMELSEKAVYEEQLTQLQEQLVAAMIENSNLSSQLKEYTDKHHNQTLKIELEIERRRCRDLQEKLAQEQKRNKTAQKNEEISSKRISSQEPRNPGLGDKTNKFSRFTGLWEKLVQGIYDIIDDFTEEDPSQTAEQNEGDQLTVKQLKANIKRFGDSFKPYLRTAKGIQNLLSWKNPAYTLIVFTVYMYAVWVGWLLPVLLSCLCFRLFISYLESLGLNIRFNFFDPGEEAKDDVPPLGISDQFNLVLDVARKVQNALGQAADGLEKIKSLLTWKTPATRSLFFMLLISVFMFAFFPADSTIYGFGLMLGVKIFIINYFYNKYPRIKRKHDGAYKLWQSLPTDREYQKKSMQSEIDKYIIVSHEESGIHGEQEVTSQTTVSEDDKAFCQLFSLPDSESPMTGWKGGRRCTLINKEKTLGAAFKNGKLYLTKSFICFERKKTPSPRNIIIPLTDIQSISKAKPYSLLPGTGMALDIVVTGDKHFVFGGIINRDEAYDSILDIGMKKLVTMGNRNTM
ncbi:hypothetical protein KUTeg_021061 [Tegillarca granosa]|uniref:GRAM domain-containing protein n=1 Tax=Tegillarca granosa TaxID=220873 RepID=A0ABQ9E9N2_TEGGR|nr:hypothetical protein KUTeg_021061 [Tegillarca granosa]